VTVAGEPAEPDGQEPEFSALMRDALTKGIGGWRGTIDSSIPVLVFVIVKLFEPLKPAVGAAAGAGVALMLVRLARRQSVQQAIGGLGGLAIACLFALRSGKASGFYLPGILYACFLAAIGAVTMAVNWPLAGIVLGFLDEQWKDWRDEPRLRRLAGGLTGMWTLFYAIKAGISGSLYVSDHSTGLAGVRLALGWPPFILLGLATVSLTRRAMAPEPLPMAPERTRGRASGVPPSPPSDHRAEPRARK
jgi:hypothetical protein